MPWNLTPVSEQRLAFVNLVQIHHLAVAEACRRCLISRKTGYKWLQRHRDEPLRPLVDHSRRPDHSPARTCSSIEQRILEVRDRYRWGARKIHAVLSRQGLDPPSIRTVHAVLRRHDRIQPRPTAASEPRSFVRSRPNELWQMDHKGPLEVARRRRYPITIIDDHSRYLFPMKLCDDLAHQTAWDHLWEVFGHCGMPEQFLCDNAFSTRHLPRTLTAFERDLIRLDITPIHGRPYHPQTQGKVERIHGTFERELYPAIRRDSVPHFEQDAEHWRNVYNCSRPHEGLDDDAPITRWLPSTRIRPKCLPDVEYPADAQTRAVSKGGHISYRGYHIAAGEGLAQHRVRIEERDDAIAVYYSWKLVRIVPNSELSKGIRL